MQASPRTVFSAPSLVRLLARLSDANPREAGLPLLEQLSEWLRWTDAIALSNALDGGVAVASTDEQEPVQAEVQRCAQVRASLAKAIAEDGAFVLASRPIALPLRGMPAAVPASDAPEYGAVRQHYLATQQLMQLRIADLRERVRTVLTSRSAQLARLAALDATMEQALAEREHALLARVPAVLEGHFKRLQQAARDAADAAATAGETGARPDAWLEVFRKDMQSALLAELAIRFQPIDGLLAALRVR